MDAWERALVFTFAALLLVSSLYLFYLRYGHKPRPRLFHGFLIVFGALILLFFSGLSVLAGMGEASLSPRSPLTLNDAFNCLALLFFIALIAYGFAWRDYTVRYNARRLYRQGLSTSFIGDPDDYDVLD